MIFMWSLHPMSRVHNKKEKNALKNPFVILERGITPQ